MVGLENRLNDLNIDCLDIQLLSVLSTSDVFKCILRKFCDVVKLQKIVLEILNTISIS